MSELIVYKDGESKTVDSWDFPRLRSQGWTTVPPVDFGGVENINIHLPNPTADQPASYWREERRRVVAALPNFIERIKSGAGEDTLTHPNWGAGGFKTLSIDWVGWADNGDPEYVIKISEVEPVGQGLTGDYGRAVFTDNITWNPLTWLGGFTRDERVTLPVGSDSFYSESLGSEESGYIIPEIPNPAYQSQWYDVGKTYTQGKSLAPEGQLAVALNTPAVIRALKSWKSGTLGEQDGRGGHKSGNEEAWDRIVMATPFNLGQVQGMWDDLIAVTSPPGEDEEVAAPNPYDDLYAAIEQMVADNKAANAPRYDPPDPGMVSDWVDAQLQTLVGDVDPSRTSVLRDIYLRADRQQFDGQAVDPQQQVLERIRGYGDYQYIHRLRPGSITEAEWIPSQVGGLIKAGVRNIALEGRAKSQAAAGVTPANAGEAAEISELMATGRANLPSFFNKIASVAQSTFRRIR